MTDSATITLSRYLGIRLHQLGVEHLFGVPGDFCLGLLDGILSVEGVQWIGTANELNAGYAADGYARMRRGLGALVTTFGVGELSALNATAGSYAESVPVVHVVGMPATTVQAAGSLVHHSLADGDFGHFVRIAAEVSAEAIVLTAAGTTAAVDRALLVALNSSRPVYLGVPADIAQRAVSVAPLRRPLRPRSSDPVQLEAFEVALGTQLRTDPVRILVGPLVHRRAAEAQLAAVAAHVDVHVASQAASKAVLDESHPAHLGVYAGAHTVDPRTRAQIDAAGPVVLAGVVLSDFLTGFFSHGFDVDSAIALGLDTARIGRDDFRDVTLEDSLAALERVVARRGPRSTASWTPPALPEPSNALPEPSNALPEPQPDGAALEHRSFWPRIEAWLRPGTTVIAEAGTAFYGAVSLRLPDDCELLGQPLWSSIGYTVPAMLGAMLSRPEREAVLLIGDGSAQLTVQELGTMHRAGLRPIIIVLDNGGYTVERLIQSPEADYQDVVAWDWPAIPAALGATDMATFDVSSLAEFDRALDGARRAGAGALIRVALPRDDAPPLLMRIAAGVR